MLAQLVDKRGPIETVENVIIRFSYLEEALGEAESKPEALPHMSYRVEGLQMSVPGRWRVLVIVQRDGANDVRAAFEVPISVP